MAGVEDLLLLRQGVEVWNQWLEKNPTVKPYLREALLRRMDLSGANLREANLRKADLSGSKLVGTDLRSADLFGASLVGADLSGRADLSSSRPARGQSAGRHRFDQCPDLRRLDGPRTPCFPITSRLESRLSAFPAS
jgi:Pentapeptide repeats (8 copies)